MFTFGVAFLITLGLPRGLVTLDLTRFTMSVMKNVQSRRIVRVRAKSRAWIYSQLRYRSSVRSSSGILNSRVNMYCSLKNNAVVLPGSAAVRD